MANSYWLVDWNRYSLSNIKLICVFLDDDKTLTLIGWGFFIPDNLDM